MSEAVKLTYDVSADDFTHAGEASGAIKRTLKKLGIEQALKDKGVKEGDTVKILEWEFEWYE